jgi:putative hydrolase of the HAD superfamily
VPEISKQYDAVLFDFGGVILTSPFEAFAAYERDNELPADLIRTINSTNPDTNAWALFERGDVDVAGFVSAFEAEAAALGHQVDGRVILGLIKGAVRPEMVEVLRRVNAAGYATACLTNNFRGSNDNADVAGGSGRGDVDEVMAMFDHVVESSRVGVRKPEVEFYEIALGLVETPADRCVFLDDLGVNLKPARAMGMTTIKVVDAASAIAELEGHLGMVLSS